MNRPANWLPWVTPGNRIVWAECKELKHAVENRVVVPLLGDSGIKVLAEYIRERIDHNFDCLIMVSGDRGAGKSTLVLQTALELDPHLSVDNVAFRIEDFARIFQKNTKSRKKYRNIIMDESGHSFHSRDWGNRVQRTVIKHMIISRVEKEIIWELVPKRSQMDNQLRDMPYIWVHVCEPSEFVQGYAIVMTAPGQLQSMWHPERFWVHQFAFTFGPLVGELWDEYEKRKIAFVSEETEAIIKGKSSPALATLDSFIYHHRMNLKQSWAEIEQIVNKNMSYQGMTKRLERYTPPKRKPL
jgi:hypothetical protein